MIVIIVSGSLYGFWESVEPKKLVTTAAESIVKQQKHSRNRNSHPAAKVMHAALTFSRAGKMTTVQKLALHTGAGITKKSSNPQIQKTRKQGNLHRGLMQVTTLKSLTQVIQQAMKQVSQHRNIEAKTATGTGKQTKRCRGKTCGQGWRAEVFTRVQTEQVSQRKEGSATGNQSQIECWQVVHECKMTNWQRLTGEQRLTQCCDQV